MDYPAFNRNFYEEHTDISSLDGPAVSELRKKLGVKVCGRTQGRQLTWDRCLSTGVRILASQTVCLLRAFWV